MRFSWKVFLSTLIIMVLTFSVGGYVLISSLFHAALDREIDAARDENRMLRFSFETAAATIPGSGSSLPAEAIRGIVQSIESTNSGLAIRVSDQDYVPLYESGRWDDTSALLNRTAADTWGYIVTEQGGRYFMHTACMAAAGDEAVYLESARDITSLFEERAAQYGMYQKLMGILVVLNGVLIYLVSMWIARPIQRLSRATRKIAAGNYGDRVAIRSRDEIGTLAADFNSMAASLEKKIYDLEDAARRQEDFMGSFAHELKTPLTSIIGYADLLRSKKTTEEVNLIAANYIFQEGKRLESLSLKLLDLIVAKKQDFEMREIDATQLLSDIKGMMLPVLNREHIALEMDVEPGPVRVEPDLFKTLVLNLLDNARKAIRGGGMIRVIGRRTAGGYGIAVRDTGKGIPPEELGRITEAFYMVDKSRARAEGGAGLGLAICDEIVRLHGGKMGFESEPGVGTTVRVWIGEERK